MNILMFGGGVDSVCIAMIEAADGDVDALMFVDYGQFGATQELARAEAMADLFGLTLIKKKVDYSAASLLTGGSADPYVPARNLFLLSLAMAYEPSRVTFGFSHLPDDKRFSDADKRFVDHSNTLIQHVSNKQTVVAAPYLDVSKTSLVLMASAAATKLESEGYAKKFAQRSIRRPFERWLLNFSFTCWTPIHGKECGQCSHCLTKQSIYRELGL